jgi:hypothetical protein
MTSGQNVDLMAALKQSIGRAREDRRANAIRFTIVIPRVHLLTANQRLHWAQKAARSRIIRTRAKVAAQACSFSYPAAKVTVLVGYPDNR